MQNIYKNPSKKQRIHLQYRFIILLIIAVILIIISLLAPYIVPNDPYSNNPNAIRMAPSLQYPFGTDNLGRCVFSRVIMGSKTSIGATLFLISITFLFGTVLGMLCGYYEGILDTIVMRLIDIFLSVPQMVLAIAVAGTLGGSMINAIFALGFTNWIVYARLAKSQTLSLKKEEYIYAAQLGGNSDFRIMIFHIFPNIAGVLFVNATIQISGILIGFAGLSFLGLGVQIPQAEWGSMINEARAYIQLAPWAVIAPGGSVIFTAMFFNYLGDTARDLLEVRH